MGAYQKFVYRPDKTGKIRPLLVTERMPYKQGGTIDELEKRVVKDLYDLECKHGSRFNGCQEYSKKTLKRIWVDRVLG